MTDELIRAQLRKIVASQALARSERLARFLDFTVTETLAGHADQLKEFVIGVEVFDRKQDYDPRLDPIVRVEARRLRLKLNQYYETEGRNDRLRIEYPKGGYAPAIRMERGAQVAEQSPSIAVLPFSHPETGDEYEYLTDGLTEELLNALTKIQGLRVVAWNSALRLKKTPRDYATIGRELQVGVVLEGSVRPNPAGATRISAQLVSVRDGSYLWTGSYERPCSEVFSVRDQIASAVARELRVKPGPPRAHTASLEAYHFYLKGRYHWNKRTDESVALGAEYLQRAVAVDRRYALAHAGLADSHIVLAKFGAAAPREAMPKAREAALRALALDSSVAEAHVSLGSIAALFDWDWQAADAHYRRGLDMNPSYATGYQWYAHDFLAAVGRLEEAEAMLARARECDPLSVVILASSAENLMMQRRFHDAIDFYGKALELDPYFPRAHFGIGRGWLLLGRSEDAVASIRRGAALISGSPMALALLAHAHAAVGSIAEARVLLDELETLARRTRIAEYLRMRAWMSIDPARACDHLERAFEERDPRLVHIGVSPIFDDLRGLARFDGVLRGMGLAEEIVPV